MSKKREIIQIYEPFGNSFPLDPRNVGTVGDQVIFEHILPFHLKYLSFTNKTSIFSEVKINEENKVISFHILYTPISHKNTRLSIQDICHSLIKSFEGTVHSSGSYKILETKCDETKNRIEISFNQIPRNFEVLMTLPDFAIIPPNLIKLTKNNFEGFETFGPYFIKKFINENNNYKVILNRNLNYPKNLTANAINEVHYNKYNSLDFMDSLDPSNHHLIYFSGMKVFEQKLDQLKEKNYKINIFPNEWLLYAHFKENTPFEKRISFKNIIEEIKNNILDQYPISTPAYSTLPSDRNFSVTKNTYINHLKNQNKLNKMNGNELKNIKIGIYRNDYNYPIFKELFEQLKLYIPSANLGSFNPSEDLNELLDCDVIIESMGIDTRDQLSHYSFFRSYIPQFGEKVTKDYLNNVSIISETHCYYKEIENIEKIISDNAILIPIAHFPGIVAEAPGFERDPELAWSWGIQAWTYKVD